MLLHQIEQGGAISRAYHAGICFQVTWVKLMSKSVSKTTEGAAFRDWRRAHDPLNIGTVLGAARCFLILTV
jgi:hypothetical protein